jgi:hypothetical protein
MKRTEILVPNIKTSIKIIALLCVFLGCDTSSNTPECNDCGGGLVDGYLYKKVTIDDITSGLLDIKSSFSIDECIRYRMDGIDFTEAESVDNCCCTIF